MRAKTSLTDIETVNGGLCPKSTQYTVSYDVLVVILQYTYRIDVNASMCKR